MIDPVIADFTAAFRGVAVSREWSMAIGHRLPDHQGKCKNYHGHTYTLRVWVMRDGSDSKPLDEEGMVLDFGDLDVAVKPVLNMLDHGMVLQQGDPMIPLLEREQRNLCILSKPPTVENIAVLLAQELRGAFKMHGVTLIYLSLSEGPNSRAEVSLQHPLPAEPDAGP